MSPDDTRKHDLMCLAAGVVQVLGAAGDSKVTTTEELYKRTLERVQVELMVIIHVVGEEATPASFVCEVLEGIQRRIDLAVTCGSDLIKHIADGTGLA